MSTEANTVETLDLDETVRAFLDGAIGEQNPTTLDEAIAMIAAYAEDRTGRHLIAGDRVRLGIAVAVAWNQRHPEACDAVLRQAAEYDAKRPRYVPAERAS